nr:hypothetical protein [Rummeliibacillus sp. SL167]
MVDSVFVVPLLRSSMSLEEVIQEKFVTPYLGGHATTEQVGNRICEKLKTRLK